jgi:hypothetical protein
MDEQLRTRNVKPGGSYKFLMKGTIEVADRYVPTTYSVYEKLIDGEWLAHREDGPAVVSEEYENDFFIDGEYYEKEEFLIRTTKLGRILYG